LPHFKQINLTNFKIPPKISALDTIVWPEVVTDSADNDIPIYQIIKPSSEIVLIDIVFTAGRLQEQKQMVASCTAALLSEGTKMKSSQEIAELVDFYGATLRIRADFDTCSIKMLCMTKHFTELKPLLEEILLSPSFDSSELELLKSRRKERLKTDLQKNDIVSYRKLTESMFGEYHPYGYNSEIEKYKTVQTEDLKKHYEEYFIAQNCKCFVAGDISSDITKELKGILSQIPKNRIVKETYPYKPRPSTNRNMVLKGSPLQTSIRLGRPCFKRSHPDYHKLLMVNTILGGYFGSRLTTNIREEKGLTYSIYSMLDTHLIDGSIMISTEVDHKSVGATIVEIEKEMNQLCQDKVSEDELALVKNYISGMYINFFDGPLNSIKAIKSLALNNIPLDELRALLDISRSISASDVLDTSQNYLNRNDFWTVTVG